MVDDDEFSGAPGFVAWAGLRSGQKVTVRISVSVLLLFYDGYIDLKY